MRTQDNQYFKFLIINIILSLFVGCAITDPRMNYESDRSKIISSVFYETNDSAITKKVLFIGDNQINENHGYPAFIQSSFADQFVAVSRRPVQQTIFGEEILRQILKSEQVPVIHLGDALNLSCKSEFERFIKLMNESNLEWVMAPGNHDGFFTGVTLGTDDIRNGGHFRSLHPDYGRDRDVWEAVCKNSIPLTKPTLVQDYLEVLKNNSDKRVSTIRSNKNCAHNIYQANLINESYSCIYSDKTRKDRPWASFIIQKIDISNINKNLEKVSLILIDTSVYENSLLFREGGAGVIGGLGKTQRAILEEWLTNNAKAGILTILAGHHPIKQLNDKDDIKFLTEHSKNRSFLYYISAHTHSGAIYFHDKDTQKEIAEINLGSIYDSPIEYRYFELFRESINNQRVVAHAPLLRISDPNSKFDSSCKNIVLPKSGEPHSIETQASAWANGPYTAKLMEIRAELHLLNDLFRNFPSSSSDLLNSASINTINHLLVQVKSQQELTKKCRFKVNKFKCEKKWGIDKAVRDNILPPLRDIFAWERTRSVSDKEAYSIYKACQAKLASDADLNYGNNIWRKMLSGGKNIIP
ncbi:metallophosphoesterase [Nitrosomonas ureae]|uniref:Calcineurin-like phosphoesterase n=1 Tax=Nitrosomonas ureae TaxID=44577 RepID=A0A1H9G831_9PROT|nr:metallophosphoesterase [Nitrosomonas ureae]SEQ46252.1 Calcineurin-like phosphoesterase [Nitrosomonas ureae]